MASETKRRRWLPAPFSRRATIVWAVIVAVLLVAGAYFMYDRLANGLGMAGATNSVPWGLWVVVYIWFSGLAGGLYLLSALVYLLRIPRFAPVARMALGLSVVSLVVSMIFIGIDLGAIRHSLGTLLFFHWSSPLAWEIKAYMFFMVVAVAQFVLVLLNDKRAAEAAGEPSMESLRRRGNVNLAIRVLAGVGVATSFVGPPGGTGMFFAAVKTRGLWEGGITSVLFYVMAVVTAAAFLIVAYRLLARLRGARPDGSALVGLNRVLAASLFALAFCVFFQIAPPFLALRYVLVVAGFTVPLLGGMPPACVRAHFGRGDGDAVRSGIGRRLLRTGCAPAAARTQERERGRGAVGKLLRGRRFGRRVVRRGFDGQGGARWKRSIKTDGDAMPQASLSVRACSERLRGAPWSAPVARSPQAPWSPEAGWARTWPLMTR